MSHQQPGNVPTSSGALDADRDVVETLARSDYRLAARGHWPSWDDAQEWIRDCWRTGARNTLARYAEVGLVVVPAGDRDVAGTAARLVALSLWIDSSNRHRSTEAVLWGRVAKVAEEAGEAIAALVGYTGQNPRKGVTHDAGDLVEELLDVAVTALGAVEHVRGHDGRVLELLAAKVESVALRAGVAS